jgi:diacylglycerol kinase
MFKSFKDAFHGINDALKSEPNLRIHFLATILAIILAYYLKFNLTEFAVLTLTIFSVVILELVNTVIEKLVDMHSLEISEEARIIKDISAGAVLLSAIMAAIIGLLLFLPKLF